MNSLILSSLAAFGRWFMNLWRASGLYALLMRIYNGISSSWENSAVMRALRGEKTESPLSRSKAAKVLFLPFTLLTALKNKMCDFLETNIRQSAICTWSRRYIHSFMALNTRMLGTMIMCAAIAYCIIGHRFSVPAISIGAAGFVMCIFCYNIMGFLNGSKVVDFLKNAAGFKELDFEFYDESKINPRAWFMPEILIGIAAGAMMTRSLIFGAAIPFAVFFVLLVLYAPITGVFLAVFAAPLVPTMVLAGICLLTALSLIIKSLSDRDFKWRFDGVGFCIILFLLVLLISSMMSFSRTGSLKVWAMYFVFVGFYFVILNSVKTKEQLYSLFKLLAISGALVALYGVAQYLFGWTTANAWIDEAMFEDSTMRVYSTLGNPNVLGEYLLLVLPVAAVFMLKYKFRELPKWIYGAMFIVMAACLILTQSRGCWIGFMLAAVIFVTFYEGKLWGLVPLILLILPFVLPQTITERIMSVGNMNDSSTSYRVYIWLGTLGMMKHYWLGGIGMGEAAFSKVYPFFSYNAIIAPHSHNTFLQLLVEAGIGALAVFLVMQTVFVKQMSVVYRRGDKKSTDSMLALAAGCGVIGFLVQSMFDYTFYNYRVMAVFFMVIALGMALKHMAVPEKEGR